MLTARGEVEDKITGLDLGADDYMAKPFSLAGVTQQDAGNTQHKHGLKSNVMSIHDFEIDIQNRSVSCNGQTINLTKKEFDLLHYLALHKNRVLTHINSLNISGEMYWKMITNPTTLMYTLKTYAKNFQRTHQSTGLKLYVV